MQDDAGAGAISLLHSFCWNRIDLVGDSVVKCMRQTFLGKKGYQHRHQHALISYSDSMGTDGCVLCVVVIEDSKSERMRPKRQFLGSIKCNNAYIYVSITYNAAHKFAAL